MKKVIAVPAGRWARELLTLAGAERIEYFLDDDPEIQKNGFFTGTSVKPVYPVDHAAAENPDDIVIVICGAQGKTDILWPGGEQTFFRRLAFGHRFLPDDRRRFYNVDAVREQCGRI